MKQNLTFIYLLLSTVIFCGCEESKVTTRPTPRGGTLTVETGIFSQTMSLDEFDYKGHRYISCKVRDGVALTHAGHCWCNVSKK